MIKKEAIKKSLPTFNAYLERRREKKRNQLPKHLRPISRGPVFFQIALNIGVFITLSWLMLNRDDFVTEAAPAMGLVICLLLLIYTLISALQLKHQFQNAPGRRWTVINFWLMVVTGLMFPATVSFFLP